MEAEWTEAVEGADEAERPSPETEALLELARMESALVRATLQHPDALHEHFYPRLRYLLSFARLSTFQPGAADGGRRGDRADVSVEEEVAGFRSRVVFELRGPLREERDPLERLRRARIALDGLEAPLRRTRRRLMEAHANDFSEAELDAEVGRKVLVLVAGGGGGAGYVYIGACERLERAGIVPSYVIGSSIGALMGLFRARAVPGMWEEWIEFAKGLDRRTLFSPVSVSRRYGLPGLFFLNLASEVGPIFAGEDGEPLRIRELAIPYEAVVAGVRRRSFNRLPRRFRSAGEAQAEAPPSPGPGAPAPAGPKTSRRLRPGFAAAIATRMWQVTAFFDPRLTRPIVLGGDELTAECNAVDAAGFSAAIPGVIQYEAPVGHGHMDELLAQLFEREEVAALVDGGVASNVPAGLAWHRVHDGKLGTRNAFYLAFDCFHPQWDPRHLWLQPITQAVQLQMIRNAPYADWILRFEPTLSPINLVPPPEQVDQAIDWGRDSVEAIVPMVQRALEPVAWEE